ncbi:hypothetical protein [Halovenus halobia]|uniref:hypothetical protein n=1 Tax=Halovenus halobia TaxID=3396622 RepID=UPI003F54A315
MTTRRKLLAGIAGTTAAIGLAGCSLFGGNSNDDNGQVPNDGLDTDDELLLSMGDPSAQVPPSFFTGYQYRVQEIADAVDLSETVPRLGGQLVTFLEENIGSLDPASLDRVTGSNYHASASQGALQVRPLPSGQTVHLTGEFDADPWVEFFEGNDGYESLDSMDGYERFFAETQDGQGYETWGVQDGRAIVVSRTDIVTRNERYDSNQTAAEEALTVEFDQVDRDNAPIANSAPAFAETVQQLDDEPIRGGTGYALIPLGADTGTTAFDDVVEGVVGGGLSASVGTDSSLQRTLSYLEPEMVSEERLTAAFERSETDSIPADSWDMSTTEATISARTTVAETPETAMLQTALPIPGYDNLFVRINPSDLGREVTPRVFFRPELNDGRLTISHQGGGAVENLQVRYVHAGETQTESWSGPVEQGDEFTSSETVDSGTQAWVTWRPDTKDAAVLIRFRPE